MGQVRVGEQTSAPQEGSGQHLCKGSPSPLWGIGISGPQTTSSHLNLELDGETDHARAGQ